jgi:microsomal dipeptidase-like Zn-dependent dipeptidase
VQQVAQVADVALFTDLTFEAGGAGWKVETSFPYGTREVFAARDGDAIPQPPASMPLGGDYWQPPTASTLLGRGGGGRGYFDSGIPRQGMRSVGWEGSATSNAFVLSKPFLQFKVGGQPDPQVAVELQVQEPSGGFTTIKSVRGSSPDGFLQRVVWEVRAQQGRRARLLIRDQASTSFITADDFQLSDTDQAPSAPVTSPALWGFADTHAHPAAHLAFGGQTYWGDPTWDPIRGLTPETTLLDCTPGHGFGGTGLRDVGEGLDIVGSLIWPGLAALSTPVSNGIAGFLGLPLSDTLGNALANLPVIPHDRISRLSLNALEQTAGHGTNGSEARKLREWPRHNSRTHQHMHEAWIKRSYDGGLRLMVAHVVETELVANLNPKPNFGALNNRTAVERQITWIKQMAARHSTWMEIALTPADARRIIGQNKLALVLGVEVDHLGDFGRPGGPEASEANVRAYFNELQRLGVRHLYSIHFADNPFGACSLYNPIFDLNHFVLTGTMHQVREGADSGVFYKSVMGMSDLLGKADRDLRRGQLRNAVRTKGLENIRLNGGLNVPMGPALDAVFSFEDAHRADFTGANRNRHGFLNASGLNPLGEFFLREVIARGMILDVDHLSDLALERTLTICETEATDSPDGRGYPLVAGHTTFRALSLTPGDPLFDDHTTAHEGDKSERAVERLRALGGMVSPILAGKAVKPLAGSSVPNNCPDSSSSFAQQYLYGVQKMGGAGVGLATDMALNGAFGPRFGPGAAHSVASFVGAERTLGYDHEKEGLQPAAVVGLASPWQQVWYGQNNPVAYRTLLSDWGGYRWEHDGGYTQRERDTFCALAAFFAGESAETFERKVTDLWQMPVYGFLSAIGATLRDSPLTFGLGPALDGRRKWMINVIKGFSRNSVAEISAPLLGDSFKGPDIELAALDVKQGRGPRRRDQLPVRVGTPPFDYDFYFLCHQVLSKVHGQMKKVKDASRAPLERSTLGARQFDFNYDGLAHYGMLPDMLQDMKNNGMTAREFVPLFRSAEDYVLLWERCQNFTSAAKLQRTITNPNLKNLRR